MTTKPLDNDSDYSQRMEATLDEKAQRLSQQAAQLDERARHLDEQLREIRQVSQDLKAQAESLDHRAEDLRERERDQCENDENIDRIIKVTNHVAEKIGGLFKGFAGSFDWETSTTTRCATRK